jgi:micrococcal nuclease
LPFCVNNKSFYTKDGANGAIFYACLLSTRLLICVLLLLGATAGSVMADCAHPPRNAETVTVRHVHDGDTLILEDKRKLRLLGYNSPEIARRERPADALGPEATEQLAQLIEGSGRQIRLQYDAERKDRYGRTLAHVFLKDGRSVAALMLQTGLATSLIIPPNLQHAACYGEAERRARAQQQGVWKLPAYQAADWTRLKAHRNRYTVLQGRVYAVEQDADGFIIRLGGDDSTPQVRVFIAGADLELFPQRRLKTLTGRKIEVRGWLHRRDKDWSLQLRHPASFDAL